MLLLYERKIIFIAFIENLVVKFL